MRLKEYSLPALGDFIPRAALRTVVFTALSALLSTAGRAQQPATDVTFAFTSDIHVSYNGINDAEGIKWDGGPALEGITILDETASDFTMTRQHDSCTFNGPTYDLSVVMTKDLCNQIQHVRKLNALPLNSWMSTPFVQSQHSRKLASSGPIAPPRGVIIGGDLTDCGGGVDDGNCDYGGYGTNSNGAQIAAFKALYDRKTPSSTQPFSTMSFLRGLQNPNADVPLKYDIYPGYGNHDLQFSGAYMQTYLMNWLVPAWGAGKVNPDLATQSYSWDWGKLHIVNVGVFPGCNSDGNLDFDQASMDWLKNDLAVHASDGRPVIIVSHFGFDSYSLGSGWWGDPNRIQGELQFWPMIRNYNLIGFFHGHNHDQSAKVDGTPGWYGYPTTNGNGQPASLPYDIFQPGAGFDQNFAVVRVTDNNMDVMITADQSDFVNDAAKNVKFGGSFTKILVQAPRAATQLTVDDFGDKQSVGFNANGSPYVLGVNGIGMYSLRVVNAAGVPSLVDRGAFALSPAVPTSLVTYQAGGSAHVLGFFGNKLVDYTVTRANKLVPDWEQTGIYGSGVMPFSTDGILYLMVDASLQTGTLDIYKIGGSSVSLQSQVHAKSIPDAVLQPFAYPSGNLGVLRYAGTGQVEYDGITLENGAFALKVLGAETWPMGSSAFTVPMPDNTTQIFIASRACGLFDSAGGCIAANIDSPYYIRTLLPDYSGTDISWRGMPAGFPAGVNQAFVLGTNPSTAMVTLGGYDPFGFYVEFTLQTNEPTV